jgi:hypothetical protein
MDKLYRIAARPSGTVTNAELMITFQTLGNTLAAGLGSTQGGRKHLPAPANQTLDSARPPMEPRRVIDVCAVPPDPAEVKLRPLALRAVGTTVRPQKHSCQLAHPVAIDRKRPSPVCGCR